MVPLRTRGIPEGSWDPTIGRITRSPEDEGCVLLYSGEEEELDRRLPPRIVLTERRCPLDTDQQQVHSLPSTSHLQEGDIVVVHPNGLVETLYRANSAHNALFITDRCNSNCLMCSQPPRDVDDLQYFYELNTRLITYLPKDVPLLGITGGEPTLLGNRLVSMLALLRDELPDTEIHMLTNARAFAWKTVAFALARANHRHLVLGVPLYSDYHAHHNYVVQAQHAFEQTVLGIHNLERCGQRVEIRVVLHKQTFHRLPQLAEYIYRTFPFAEHVAFMGLEYTGYTPHNDSVLWIEPPEYAGYLEEAVGYLDLFGMNVSIYNLQLCLLPKSLWPFCRRSISDWKQEYAPECQRCSVREECGGVFATSKRLSTHLRAVS